MWEVIVNFFSQPPPAIDPLFIPWVTALVAGNIIFITGAWALLKYIASLTPWAEDDKIIQIITGGYAAVRDAVSPLVKKKEVVAAEDGCAGCEECDHKPNAPDAEVCESCGQHIK
jgi:hypothetical protein